MVRSGQLRRAIGFIRPHWRRLAIVLLLSGVSTALSLYVPILSRDFFDRALMGRDLATLIRVVALFTGVTLASFVINAVSGLRYTRVSADILFAMRLELYRHLQRLSPRFYARTRIGDVMSRINNDIGEIQRIAAETVLAWVGNIFFLIGTIGMLAWLDARLFVVTLVTTPLGLWALVRYRSRLEREVATVRQRSADIGSFLVETLQAMRLVVTANAQEREALRFSLKNAAFVESLMSMQWLTYLSGGVPGLILSVGTAAVFLYGGVRVVRAEITVGTFVAFMTCQMRVMPPLQALMGMYANLATVRVSLGRVAEILDAPVEVQELTDAKPLGPVRGIRGHVEFERVSLAFDRGAPVLEDVSFAIRPGEVAAIVGRSGSGKSTIADLLVRLLDPDEGRILLDGLDIRGVRLGDLRRAVALVEQEPCLLHATIEENIKYGRPDASEADVTAAARRAALDGFVQSLPGKYRTVVGERGMALSVGERQRVAIARALLLDPAVLVLDEPSASLDPAAEREIAEGYEAAMQGRTTIVITHRAELARRADRIIRIADVDRSLDGGAHGAPAREVSGGFRGPRERPSRGMGQRPI